MESLMADGRARLPHESHEMLRNSIKTALWHSVTSPLVVVLMQQISEQNRVP